MIKTHRIKTKIMVQFHSLVNLLVDELKRLKAFNFSLHIIKIQFIYFFALQTLEGI